MKGVTEPGSPPAGRELAKRADADLLAMTPEILEAFEIFYVRHARAVLSYLARRTGNRDVALDLTAEVFAAALASPGRYRPEQGPARAWLFGIASNKLAVSWKQRKLDSRLRRKLGMPRIELGSDELERVEEVVDASRAGYMEALATLPRHEAKAVRARVIHERAYAEIAQAENTSQAAVRQRVSRGLGRLRFG
jgi:RNA polymerase sigma factor (sigma-70 family)